MYIKMKLYFQEIEFIDIYGSTTTWIVVGPFVFIDWHLPIDPTFCVIHPSIVTSVVLI